MLTMPRNFLPSHTGRARHRPAAHGLGVPFDVITAEQAQAFKPDHRLFAYAFQRLGCQGTDVLHVGAGYPPDMVSAFELRIPPIWINRRREAGDRTKPPTRELSDLADLPAWVESPVQNHREPSHSG